MGPRLTAALCAVLLLLTVCSAQSTAVPTELVVRFKPANGNSLSAEQVVSVLTGLSTDPARETLANRLGQPTSANFVIHDRVPPVPRAELALDDPKEVLQRYVLLTYATALEAESGHALLLADPDVETVGFNLLFDFHQAPGDPLFYPPGMPIERSVDDKLDAATPEVIDNTLNPDRPAVTQAAADPIDYQWQFYDEHFQYRTAWDTQRGSATVATLDNGIQLNPLHPDLRQAWRPSYAYNVIDQTNYVDEFANSPQATAAGHGTHVAGLIAATTNNARGSYPEYPNPASEGTAASCWFCNLMVIKVSHLNSRNEVSMSMTNLVAGIDRAVRSGAQVLNLSLGLRNSVPQTCDNQPAYGILCDALNFTEQRGVVVVAAAGNDKRGHLDFPAIDPRTLAVGGMQGFAGNVPVLWSETAIGLAASGSNTGAAMQDHGVVAPARYVLSTVYTGRDWSAKASCGDSTSFKYVVALEQQTAPGSSAGPGYGSCSGTSMAAPIISGIAGMMMSARPLSIPSSIRGSILNAGSHHESTTNELGHGFVNAYAAVGTANQLTPLLSFYGHNDHFYTVFPQMGAAAYHDELRPRNENKPFTRYMPFGQPVLETRKIPGTAVLLGAQVWVFAGHVNPHSSEYELRPLLRLSYVCGQNGVTHARCATNPTHVDHTYSTDTREAQMLIAAQGYEFDGIEGYVYPAELAQPQATVALVRAYNQTLDDYAIFPVTNEQGMINNGYSVNRTVLGYAYWNDGCIRPIVY